MSRPTFPLLFGQRPRALALLAGAVLCLCASARAAAPASQPWLDDFAQLKATLEARYANLAWKASPQGGVDLPALEKRTREGLAHARDEAQARQQLRDFIKGFGDGHLSELVLQQSLPGPVMAEPATRDLHDADAADGCAALGYDAAASVAFSLPFETLPGFHLLADGLQAPVRTGLVVDANGHKIGLVRLQSFRANAYPGSCRQAWQKLRAKGKDVTPKLLADEAHGVWLDALAERLRELQAQGAQGLLVDVGHNSGGNDTGDWIPRMFSRAPVHSARLMMVADASAAPYFDEQIKSLSETDLASAPPEARKAFEEAIAFFERGKAQLQTTHCDMSWVWQARQDWASMGCKRMVDAGFAGGALSTLPAGAFGNKDLASTLSGPSNIEEHFGVWHSGPVAVWVDGESYSSAEMFAAVMQDQRVGRIVGVRSGADGCGFMTGIEPLVLEHTGLRFRIPNCMRLRADGSNEEAGVSPDLPLPARKGESQRVRAMRALEALGLGGDGAATPAQAPGQRPAASTATGPVLR